jgi:hypothetical protein
MAPMALNEAASSENRMGHANRQIFRYEIDFAMIGVTRSGAGYALSGMKLSQPGRSGDHRSRAAVAERGQVVQAGLHLLIRCLYACGPGKVDHQADQVRPRQGLAQKQQSCSRGP